MSDGCYACIVGVATGPESHDVDCVARNIPMPVQDGQWGPEWDEYDRRVAAARANRGDALTRGTVKFMSTWPALDEEEAELERAEQRARAHEDL